MGLARLDTNKKQISQLAKLTVKLTWTKMATVKMKKSKQVAVNFILSLDCLSA